MIGKLFRRQKVPQVKGTIKMAPDKLEGIRHVKAFELELSNMEGSPCYALTHQLSVGKEIGNIVIADPSISPRHATFMLQDEVVSVVDHGSVTGTLVNGKKISPGKNIILEESDIIRLGDLEIHIKVRTVAEKIPEIPAIPETPVPQTTVTPEALELETAPRRDNVVRLHPKTFSSHKKPTTSLVIQAKKDSANTLVRLVAMLLDLLLAYSILLILMPFDEFRSFLSFIQAEMVSLLQLDTTALISLVGKEYDFIFKILEDLYSFLTESFHIAPLFFVFVGLRLLSTALLKVSIGEFLVSIRGHGNALWARLGGLLRVLIGVATGPLLLFDLPAIVSKRTFKEFITFTRTYLSSSFLAILGTLFFVPLFLSFALLAPLFQGFTPPETIAIESKLEQRVRVAKSDTDIVSAPQSVLESQFLKLILTYNPEAISIMPSAKFQGKGNRVKVQTPVVFYDRELQRAVTFELMKTFDLRQLLRIGFKGNFFIFEKYPEIYSFIYEMGNVPGFKPSSDVQVQSKFANEFMRFTETAFGLSLDNALEFLQNETPLLKGYIDYKNSLMALLEYKEQDKIGFIKLGNVIFMKISYMKQQPFDLLIPLIKGEGRVFKIGFDKKENLSDLSSKFYKYTLDQANWLTSPLPNPHEPMTPFEVIDFFTSLGPDKKIMKEQAQSLYGHYYEKSAELLNRNDPVEIDLWKNSVDSIYRVIEILKTNAKEEDAEIIQKIFQNFRDLKDAIENKNREYFGLSSTV